MGGHQLGAVSTDCQYVPLSVRWSPVVVMYCVCLIQLENADSCNQVGWHLIHRDLVIV